MKCHSSYLSVLNPPSQQNLDIIKKILAITCMKKKVPFATQICPLILADVRAKSKRTGLKISRITEDALKKEVSEK